MRVELTKKNGKHYIDITNSWEDRGCGLIFTASNGWELRSLLTPSLYAKSKIFYVNGFRDVDNTILCVDGSRKRRKPFPCEIPKGVYDGIKQLLTEYKDSLEL